MFSSTQKPFSLISPDSIPLSGTSSIAQFSEQCNTMYLPIFSHSPCSKIWTSLRPVSPASSVQIHLSNCRTNPTLFVLYEHLQRRMMCSRVRGRVTIASCAKIVIGVIGCYGNGRSRQLALFEIVLISCSVRPVLSVLESLFLALISTFVKHSYVLCDPSIYIVEELLQCG